MLIKTFVFSLFSIVACAAAQADTTVLNDFTSSSGATNTLVIGTTGLQVGQAFMTGTTLLTLSSVVFPQVAQDAQTNNIDGYQPGEQFGLFTSNLDGTANLAAPLYTFSLTDNTVPGTGFGDAGFATITATAPTGLTNTALLPNTRYWLVLSYSSIVQWNYTTSTSYASQLGVTIPALNSAFATDPGSTPGYMDLADGPQLLSINAVPVAGGVPEPSTYCLMAVAGLAFVVSRKRTRKLA